ncbi:flagellar hook capping protein [Alkalidesulfovibrio alkalitolerans DSM 16529]|uniref:Basal-body rod modification protein FlgD n=1 Tax=Alkalidesulfovibrio alkalitolerans DSM 16529 TaxID=1121439 RepID=S7TEI4_9BACT|nr:flagellar hook assembly protein FlgD [Alkalidesulfovibrio alkalitolerans]EPR35000.1 flagellar hook capping protein [Alkalidesulfovibrio alkalitolerans DSM 16529]
MAAYVDTTSYLNSMYSSSARESSSTELGKDAFLTLFVAQLKNQDPLNPMDDKEYVSQLAQFSSLEQLTNISSGMEGVAAMLAKMQQLSATSYIGMDVLAAGSGIHLAEGKSTEVRFVVPEDATNVTAHIYDKNGNIVRSVDMGGLSSGEYAFSWDGKDSDNSPCEDGAYDVAFTAEDANGEWLYVSTLVEGRVTGVFMESGAVMLNLSDGRSVALYDVHEVRTAKEKETAANEDDASDDSKDSSGDEDDLGEAA